MDPASQLAAVPARPTRLDLGLAVALLLWALLEAVTIETGGPAAERFAFCVAVTVPLLWRRRHVLLVLAVVAVAVLLRGVTADAGDHGAAPFPTLLVLTFTIALHVRPTPPAVVLGAVPALLMASLVLQDYYGPEAEASLGVMSFFCLGAWALGRMVRRAADKVEDEKARAQELAARSVEEERARIARELHDVVAHAVSIVVVQAGAAEAVLEVDPRRAREHLQSVRRTGREALAEMRHLLQVLRDGEASYSPQPTLAGLEDLAADLAQSGTAVSLDLALGDEELPAGVELCAYRVVQEALTNVRKHASGAPATVSVRRDGNTLVAEVVNPRGQVPPLGIEGAGHGLVGMRERVRLYGGVLDAGPTADGFRVTARIPLDPSDRLGSPAGAAGVLS